MRRRDGAFDVPDDPLWYKDAVIYQTHVRAFHDSNADGIGDFHGLRVITELVINHTSDQHPWFQRARRAPRGSAERDFYVWSETPNKYRGTRIIFQDFEPSNWSLDPIASAYYWHRFYAHQPDLNFDNPEVRKAVFKMLEFWLKRWVDGLRLDAIPYLYEREGSSCENLPQTHAFLKELRRHTDKHFKNRMLLAEANQWPEDAVAYFERRTKASPLRDVGGMLRSFHYASFTAAVNHSTSATLVNFPALEPWLRFWYEWVTASFTKGYLTAANDAVFLPKERQKLRVLLDAYILDKAVYELGYELNNRPSWVGIPLRGILHIIEAGET